MDISVLGGIQLKGCPFLWDGNEKISSQWIAQCREETHPYHANVAVIAADHTRLPEVCALLCETNLAFHTAVAITGVYGMRAILSGRAYGVGNLIR